MGSGEAVEVVESSEEAVPQVGDLHPGMELEQKSIPPLLDEPEVQTEVEVSASETRETELNAQQINLDEYDWELRARKSLKFDGRRYEGRLVHPYSGLDVTCFGDSIEETTANLRQLAADAENARAKYLKGRKTPEVAE